MALVRMSRVVEEAETVVPVPTHTLLCRRPLLFSQAFYGLKVYTEIHSSVSLTGVMLVEIDKPDGTSVGIRLW